MTARPDYVAVLNPRKRKARRVLHAWVRGTGARTVTASDLAKLEVRKISPVFYGVDEVTLPAFALAERARRYVYIDNGYLRSKYHQGPGPVMFRVTWAARQVDGLGTSDGSRFAKLGIELQPWRRRGDHIVVAVQSDWWYQRRGLQRASWVAEVLAGLSQVTDRPVVVREKPTRYRPAPPIADVLRDAWCTVSLDSNVAIDGLIAGIPAVVLGPCAAAAVSGTALHQVVDPPMPADRLRWCHVLADNQWSLGEIAAGMAASAIERGNQSGANHEKRRTRTREGLRGRDLRDLSAPSA